MWHRRFGVSPSEESIVTRSEQHRLIDDQARRSQVTRANLWVKRDLSSGRFLEAKKKGGSFKGVRRER